MIIRIEGAIVGRVVRVEEIANADRILLAHVDLDDSETTVPIVFGGRHQLTGDELVPVAPPGSRAFTPCRVDGERSRKMRIRRYRNERSHGMLCSLDELGWTHGGPDEVALLQDVTPGQGLDDLPLERQAEIVVGWQRARTMEVAARAHIGQYLPTQRSAVVKVGGAAALTVGVAGTDYLHRC